MGEQIRRVRGLWASGNLSGIDGVLNMPQDHAVVSDFVRSIMRESHEAELNLDACQALLPLIVDLLGSKHEDFATQAAQFAEVLLQRFGDLIVDTRVSCSRTPERQLSLRLEERL